MASRALQRAAHRFADQQSDRLRTLPRAAFMAEVSAVTVGAAADGNALVTVSWRGEEILVAGYANSYTPVIGHRVKCSLVDDQPVIDYRVVGYP